MTDRPRLGLAALGAFTTLGGPAVDPEEALVAALSSCHMLFALSRVSKGGYVAESYADAAKGIMGKRADGKTALTQVTLRPVITFFWNGADAGGVRRNASGGARGVPYRERGELSRDGRADAHSAISAGWPAPNSPSFRAFRSGSWGRH